MFAHPEYLYLLLFVPLFFAFFAWRLRACDRFLRSHIKEDCLKMVANSSSRPRRLLKQGLLFMVFVFLILSLARPQSTQKEKTTRKVQGAEVMLLADVSQSMLVRDMGGLSRLQVMKKELDKLIQLLAGQRVGLISFSGSASLVSPLTLDHVSLRLFLKGLTPADHILQGSDFGQALSSAGRALKRGSALAPDSSARVILIASDGEDNENQALSAVEEVARQKIHVWALGFGTKKGGLIPISQRPGHKSTYKKDKTGQPIVSRFNENTLKQIAQRGQGAFYFARPGSNTINRIYEDIQAVGRDALSHHTQNQYREWYAYCVALSLLFGFLYFLMGEKKTQPIQMWHGYTQKIS